MAETENSGGRGQPPKEMSMEIRLLLAFLLMGAVMFLTPYFVKTSAARVDQEGGNAGRRPRGGNRRRRPRRKPLPRRGQAKAAARKRLRYARSPKQNPLPPLVMDTDLFRISSPIRAQTCGVGCSRSTRAATANRWNWPTQPPAWIIPFRSACPVRTPSRRPSTGRTTADAGTRRPGRRLRLHGRQRQRAKSLPVPEEQLSLGGLDRSYSGRQARAQHDSVARRIRRFHGSQSDHQPGDAVLRRGGKLAHQTDRPERQEWPGHVPGQL